MYTGWGGDGEKNWGKRLRTKLTADVDDIYFVFPQTFCGKTKPEKDHFSEKDSRRLLAEQLQLVRPW
jgi:hypothetical protein